MYENVVVGLNGLARDPDAVALAKTLAPGADRLALAHVRLIAPARGWTGAYDAAEREFSRELLEQARDSFANDAVIVSTSARNVGTGLHYVAESRGADLIVVGSCHRSMVGRIFAGNDARSTLHYAPCAVAVAPAGYATGSPMIETIGLAYDETEASEVALAHSALLAADLGARLHIREVAELQVYGAASWASATATLEDLDALAAAARERIGPIPAAEIDVVTGPVHTELSALSDVVDLLVCGSRQRGVAKRILLGSTSDYLSQHASCPLLVTPADDLERIEALQDLRKMAPTAG
jgi:nucleotide-binding universal stress UspA family protein